MPVNHGRISKNIAKGLKELRKRIAKAKVPASTLDKTITLATWNIREFGKKRRRKDAIHYIAEVLGTFDLTAVVEVGHLEVVARAAAVLTRAETQERSSVRASCRAGRTC